MDIKVETDNDYNVDTIISPVTTMQAIDTFTDDFKALANTKNLIKVPDTIASTSETIVSSPLIPPPPPRLDTIVEEPRQPLPQQSTTVETKKVVVDDDQKSFLKPYSLPPPPPTPAKSEDDIRREKSFFLHQYESKNQNCRYSPKILTMDNSLNEIINEVEYVNGKRELQNSLLAWKKNLFLSMTLVEQANSHFDPFEVDMSNWLRDMHFQIVSKGSYDDLLEQIIVRWRGRLTVFSPELQLGFMIASSFGMGVVAERKEKRRLDTERSIDVKMRQSVQEEVQRMMQRGNGNGNGSNGNGGGNGGNSNGGNGNGGSGNGGNSGGRVDMQGPSVSEQDILNLINSNYDESTINSEVAPTIEDEILPTISVKGGRKKIEKKAVEGVEGEKKKRGRPPKGNTLVL